MIIFIVPYRSREGELCIFLNHMKYLLEDISCNDYCIYIIHQDDTRPFNRGAMKNIGFLMAKNEYPTTYKEIDYIFHDLDNLIAIKNSVEFTTKENEINHIFGNYKTTNLGGIFVIKGGDYEKVNGFPNFWGWGYEDNCFGLRVLEKEIKIIRKHFNYYDKRVVHLNNSPKGLQIKTANVENRYLFLQRHKKKQSICDGIHTIKDLVTNKKQISKNIIQWNITDFKARMSANIFNGTERVIGSPFIKKWLQKNNLQFTKIKH